MKVCTNVSTKVVEKDGTRLYQGWFNGLLRGFVDFRRRFQNTRTILTIKPMTNIFAFYSYKIRRFAPIMRIIIKSP